MLGMESNILSVAIDPRFVSVSLISEQKERNVALKNAVLVSVHITLVIMYNRRVPRIIHVPYMHFHTLLPIMHILNPLAHPRLRRIYESIVVDIRNAVQRNIGAYSV